MVQRGSFIACLLAIAAGALLPPGSSGCRRASRDYASWIARLTNLSSARRVVLARSEARLCALATYA